MSRSSNDSTTLRYFATMDVNKTVKPDAKVLQLVNTLEVGADFYCTFRSILHCRKWFCIMARKGQVTSFGSLFCCRINLWPPGLSLFVNYIFLAQYYFLHCNIVQKVHQKFISTNCYLIGRGLVSYEYILGPLWEKAYFMADILSQ